ncbi:hypothetical protein C2W62_32270 [Candidatus Entotheonella serta]|nr:hypothetical protein C2W62_32270 [Candidatus Entotheonella serta]
MSEPITIYMVKAEESFLGAESEVARGRYNNAVNRCYYACSGRDRALRQASSRRLVGEGIGATPLSNRRLLASRNGISAVDQC